jgi:protein-tyrosine phosphatase
LPSNAEINVGSRLIPIFGAHNLRDMGGYQTSDGRELKWKTLFRSGLITKLTDSDRAEFRRLELSVIYDLRTNSERARRPVEWLPEEGIEYYCRDHERSVGALDSLIRTGDFAAHDATRAMREVYIELPFEQADSLRDVFRLLIGGRVPMLFNCTAGKDRTGLVAALILLALGVPRGTIERDYLLTELALHKLVEILLGDPSYARVAALPSERYLPILRADCSYLSAAFDEIERRAGGVKEYLETVLGIGQRETEMLRNVLLQPSRPTNTEVDSSTKA